MTRFSPGGGTIGHAEPVDLVAEIQSMHMAHTTDGWTLAELHRLPDDGNKYELVFGELFVTPPPSVQHEELASLLGRMLDCYVDAHALGRVYRPRAVLRALASEVEPDLMVRQAANARVDWEDVPLPILVVEIISDSTRRRDLVQKRAFYLDARVPEYWVVDGDHRTVRIVRAGHADITEAETLTWAPTSAGEPLVIDLRAFFQEALA